MIVRDVRRLAVLAALTGLPFGAHAQQPQPAPASPPILQPRDIPYPGVLTLAVDATDLDHGIDAITAAKSGDGPIELLVKDKDEYRTVKLDYHGGLKYPHLERVAGSPARLDDILKPLN